MTFGKQGMLARNLPSPTPKQRMLAAVPCFTHTTQSLVLALQWVIARHLQSPHCLLVLCQGHQPVSLVPASRPWAYLRLGIHHLHTQQHTGRCSWHHRRARLATPTLRLRHCFSRSMCMLYAKLTMASCPASPALLTAWQEMWTGCWVARPTPLPPPTRQVPPLAIGPRLVHTTRPLLHQDLTLPGHMLLRLVRRRTSSQGKRPSQRLLPCRPQEHRCPCSRLACKDTCQRMGSTMLILR